MTIDQVIAAQEANEAAFRNASIDRAVFTARASELDRAYSVAMIAIQKRIAGKTGLWAL